MTNHLFGFCKLLVLKLDIFVCIQITCVANQIHQWSKPHISYMVIFFFPTQAFMYVFKLRA